MHLLHARNLTFHNLTAILEERQYFHHFNDLWTDSGSGRLNNLPKLTVHTQERVTKPMPLLSIHVPLLRFIDSGFILVVTFFSSFFFPLFKAAPTTYAGSQARVNQSCSCWPMPQPWQHRIQAMPATYATAQGNARSLTHRSRPGIEPESP